MEILKKILLFVLVLALTSFSMISCGKSTEGTYTLVYGDSQIPPILFTFKDGNLKIAADTSGMNSIAIENLSFTMLSLGISEGKYKYNEKDGVITTKKPISPLSNNKAEFRSYFNEKYMILSTFDSYSISTKDTEGTSEFIINAEELCGSDIEFHKDGSFDIKDNEVVGTYTFKNGIIEMTLEEGITLKFLATGDGNCYTQYLIKK